MEKMELNEKNCKVVWNTSAEQAQSAMLGWRMLENNEIPGILPFDYYYVDDRVYFRCSYAPLERIDDYFRKNKGDFESIFSICEGVLKILERGEEYLLGKEGYLLLPEWIFWSRSEKKVSVCYFPGRRASARDEYMSLVEYMLQHADHSDKRAVSLIYGLYDMVASEGFVVENLLCYLRKGEENRGKIEDRTEIIKMEEEKKLQKVKRTGSAKRTQRIKEWEETELAGKEKTIMGDTDGKDNSCCFSLKPMKGSFTGRLQGSVARGQKAGGCMEEGQELIVGRQAGSDIYLPFAVISRKHAVFIYEDSKIYLMDISSKNGTYLNGKKISAYVRTQCRGNDVITFADISYRFEMANQRQPDFHGIPF